MDSAEEVAACDAAVASAEAVVVAALPAGSVVGVALGSVDAGVGRAAPPTPGTQPEPNTTEAASAVIAARATMASAVDRRRRAGGTSRAATWSAARAARRGARVLSGSGTCTSLISQTGDAQRRDAASASYVVSVIVIGAAVRDGEEDTGAM